MKGLIFVGCSFTWGQGLYYYSKLDTLKKQKSESDYDDDLVSIAQKKYMKKHRFARLVADNFNTYEFVKDINGGSDDGSIDYLNKLFGINFYHEQKQVSFNEIEYIIYQTTQPIRSRYIYEHKGESKEFSVDDTNSKHDFYEWIIENNKYDSMGKWEEEHITQVMNRIKTQLKFFENNGIKTLLFSWTNDYLKDINNDKWLSDRFIKLNYNNKYYDCIEYLMNEFNNMIIMNDFDNFTTPPKDSHPSMKCHKIIANSIINKINENEK